MKVVLKLDRSMGSPHHLAALYETPRGVVDQNTGLRVLTG